MKALDKIYSKQELSLGEVSLFERLSSGMEYSYQLALLGKINLRGALSTSMSTRPWSALMSDQKRTKMLTTYNVNLTLSLIEKIEIDLEGLALLNADMNEIYEDLKNRFAKNKVKNLVQLQEFYEEKRKSFAYRNLPVSYGKWPNAERLNTKSFIFENEEYSFFLPDNTDYFINSAKTLQTCIAKFAEKVLNKEVLKFFILKGNVPYCSIQPYQNDIIMFCKENKRPPKAFYRIVSEEIQKTEAREHFPLKNT